MDQGSKNSMMTKVSLAGKGITNCMFSELGVGCFEFRIKPVDCLASVATHSLEHVSLPLPRPSSCYPAAGTLPFINTCKQLDMFEPLGRYGHSKPGTRLPNARVQGSFYPR